jgi:GNAT superfamily N-acetyltransferase
VTAPPRDYHVAQINISTLLAPIDDPSIADFAGNLDHINAIGDASPGFVWRLQTDDGNATSIQSYPDPLVIVNMTVWTSIEALKEFAYRTEHADFLARRREWFAAGSSAVALWWIRAGDLPTLDDAKRRVEFLRRHGPSPYAFRFARPPAPFVVEPTTLDDPDTRDLIARLDEELTAAYDDPAANFFRLDADEVAPGAGTVIVGRLDDRPVACGALRRISDMEGETDGTRDATSGRIAEVKRMYVAPEARGHKLGAAVLDRLELEAAALGIERIVLETGDRQHEAIRLYERAGFAVRESWGPYRHSPHSRCFEKRLAAAASDGE